MWCRGKVYSQQYTLDLHLKQTSLEEVFNRIEAQTGLRIFVQYPAHRLKRESGCRSPAGRHHQSAGWIIESLGLTYILNSNHIVVKQADAAAPQEKTVIKGKVTDSKGESPTRRDGTDQKEPISVSFRTTAAHYRLTLPAGTDPTLIFSFRRYAFAGSKIYRPTWAEYHPAENIGGLFHGFLCAALPRHTRDKKHPESSCERSATNTFASPQKYTTDIVSPQFRKGSRMPGVYAEFTNRESGEKERYNPDDVITFLHNDHLMKRISARTMSFADIDTTNNILGIYGKIRQIFCNATLSKHVSKR